MESWGAVIVKRSLVGDPPGMGEGVGVAGSQAPVVADHTGNPWVGWFDWLSVDASSLLMKKRERMGDERAVIIEETGARVGIPNLITPTVISK